jgi:membrane fusion protein (multidrug efflux system)
MHVAHALLPAALSLLLVAVGCSRSQATDEVIEDAAEPTVTVETVAVERHPVPRELVLTGSLIADKSSDLAANASGRVLATYVERGQTVKAGDSIAKLDARVAKFSAKAAKAQTKVAKAALDLAALECDRADKLLATGVISQTEYDRTISQCTTSRSSVSAAESNAALASVAAGDSTIRAPFAGIIGERFIEIGEYVQPPTRVVSLYSIDPIRVSIAVPEAEASRVAEGQKVMFSVSALGERSFEAEVRYVSPALREGTRDLLIEAVTPNAEKLLHPGMFATVRVHVGEQELPTVPQSAIHRSERRSLVWVVRQGRAIETLVRTGATKDGRVAILAGLEPDDRVVVNPPEDLVDGAKIEEAGAPKAPAAPKAAAAPKAPSEGPSEAPSKK